MGCSFRYVNCSAPSEATAIQESGGGASGGKVGKSPQVERIAVGRATHAVAAGGREPDVCRRPMMVLQIFSPTILAVQPRLLTD